jgi:hypothetical protein
MAWYWDSLTKLLIEMANFADFQSRHVSSKIYKARGQAVSWIISDRLKLYTFCHPGKCVKPVRLEETSNPRLASEYIITNANKTKLKTRQIILEFSIKKWRLRPADKASPRTGTPLPISISNKHESYKYKNSILHTKYLFLKSSSSAYVAHGCANYREYFILFCVYTKCNAHIWLASQRRSCMSEYNISVHRPEGFPRMFTRSIYMSIQALYYLLKKTNYHNLYQDY